MYDSPYIIKVIFVSSSFILLMPEDSQSFTLQASHRLASVPVTWAGADSKSQDYMKSGFTQDTETSFGILLWLKESGTVAGGFLSLSLSPPFQSLFSPIL